MRVRKAVHRKAGTSVEIAGPNPVDVRLGQLMRERRKYIGLSRKGLAAQLISKSGTFGDMSTVKSRSALTC